jgi:predicted helicase
MCCQVSPPDSKACHCEQSEAISIQGQSMTDNNPFEQYLRELRKNYATGDATEHTHRPALKNLIETLGDGLNAINEPRRIDCGAPDLRVMRGEIPVGHIETKDIGKSLDEAERSDQLKRYRESLPNLILTDYLEFRWYVGGERRETVRVGSIGTDVKIHSTHDGIQAVSDLVQKFLGEEPPVIGRPKELASHMAKLAHLIRISIEKALEQESETGNLHAQLRAFQDTLIPDLKPDQFADMYAQTIAYGLFAAWQPFPDNERFTRKKAVWEIPKTNPFLLKLFDDIAGVGLDDRVAWLADDLAYLLHRTDKSAVLKDFGKVTMREDPVVHFYEDFLKAYDPKMRKSRGVYYTPEPVVLYIVRSIDYLLKTKFNKPWGLADKDVMILDPACGTGTFLYFVIQQIYDTFIKMGQKGGWSSYVKDHLLHRIFGFELLMAPYTMAHMKLGMLLKNLGYDFTGDQRLEIYLTNTLGETVTKGETKAAFKEYIAEEGIEADAIKRDKRIMVVLGNPPYSVSSVNKGPHIEKLMERYKQAVRGEKNIQPLSDDYIKFIRFAHDRIERTGYGIIGMITNNSYLSGLIHRGMREELLKSFEEVYIQNLHGNSMIKEKAPGEGKDENVFDIRQGVSISLFVKRREPKNPACIKYSFLLGLRESKYRYLLENDVNTTNSEELEPRLPDFYLVPVNQKLNAEFKNGWSTDEIFPINSTGAVTHRDHFAIDFDEQTLRRQIAALRDKDITDEEARKLFKLPDTRDWSLSEARVKLQASERWDNYFIPFLYRPFDIRSTYYSSIIIEYPRLEVMHHLLKKNLALLTCRQQAICGFRHVFCSSNPTECCAVSLKTREKTYVFPLYLYPSIKGEKAGQELLLRASYWSPGKDGRVPNLSPEFISALEGKLGIKFVQDGKGDLETTFGPEDVFHYIYAIFHSPTYRERYTEFLKIDFPRVPLTSNRELFQFLCEKGEKLVALHLMESPKLNNLITSFSVKGSDIVEKVEYVKALDSRLRGNDSKDQSGRVYINKTQYFGGIEPEVWEFHIGGYQILHKWLKDRKGRTLSWDDIQHYQKIVVALTETMRLMKEIDQVIPSWPIL